MKHFHKLKRYTVIGLLVAVLIISGGSKSEAPAPGAHEPEALPQSEVAAHSLGRLRQLHLHPIYRIHTFPVSTSRSRN